MDELGQERSDVEHEKAEITEVPTKPDVTEPEKTTEAVEGETKDTSTDLRGMLLFF